MGKVQQNAGNLEWPIDKKYKDKISIIYEEVKNV
jgi:hypothetical protein